MSGSSNPVGTVIGGVSTLFTGKKRGGSMGAMVTSRLLQAAGAQQPAPQPVKEAARARPMGVANEFSDKRRRRRGGARALTLLTDLNDERLGG